MSPVSGWVAGWRLALRLAWRDVRRSRARSALVLVMIALPVLAVTAADVVYSTSQVNSAEGLGRRLGAAEARLVGVSGGPVIQWIDPDSAGSWGGGHGPRPTLGTAEQILGHRLPSVELRTGVVRVRTGLGAVGADATTVDLGSPLAQGLFRLTAGHWPTGAGQVVINAALAGHGFAVGGPIAVDQGQPRTVVGIAESTTYRSAPVLAGAPGSLPLHGERGWLVGGGAITWPQVQALNRAGFTVLSRYVVTHPPSESELPPQARWMIHQNRGEYLAILALVVAMALLEVVLLAGPAFAVGARRQSRTLALMAATGGTPRQARRVVLASGVVLGVLASVAGAGLGIGVARLALPWVQRMSTTWFGPFDVSWWQLAAIAAFGLVSAFLAAVVPAWIASRQDVVAVLAGRRGDRRPSRRSPLLGLALLGIGIAMSALGARQNGSYLIAGSAIVAVLGMILCIPLLLASLARGCGLLPLVGRYAVRDAARHRTRTVPAVAAVAATVAGVVALGVANASDGAQARADYSPVLAHGVGAVSSYQRHPDWPAYAALVHRVAPGVTATPVLGIGGSGSGIRLHPQGGRLPFEGYSAAFGASVLVGRGAMPLRVLPDLSTSEQHRAAHLLARGGAVVLASRPMSATSVVIRAPHRPPVTVPAVYLVTSSWNSPFRAVVSPQAARRSGLTPRTVGLALTGPISSDDESRLREALTGVSGRTSVIVERGYTDGDSTRILLLVLGALGGVLMLGGTLTATFLALSDARPDLATLSAVGAAPRMRRGVAAAYALVVGLVGAVLGALVGFIPGIAVSYPLTRAYQPGQPSHYLVIPWPLILSLVVALPLLTAVVVGLTARSRLPLVARLD